VTVAKSVRQYFAAAELERLNKSRQMKDTLAADAVWFSRVNVGVFYCAVLFGLYVLFVAWRKRGTPRYHARTSAQDDSEHTKAEFAQQHTKVVVSFILMLWLGVVANAFATGALSKPHHRYQARIAWLLVLPPLLLWRDPTRSAQVKPA
jgi:H+/gluconate symporter-like permease